MQKPYSEEKSELAWILPKKQFKTTIERLRSIQMYINTQTYSMFLFFPFIPAVEY